MLTGDKMETSINISKSCGLIKKQKEFILEKIDIIGYLI